MLIKFLLFGALILSIIVPFGVFLLGEKKKGNLKAAMGFNALFFFGTLLVGNVLLFSGKVSAAEASQAVDSGAEGMRYIAAALATGMSSIGAGIAVASSASAALGAISENPGIMGKALIFVALAEGVALYGLIISITILG